MTLQQIIAAGESTSDPQYYKIWARKYDSAWAGQGVGDASWDLAVPLHDRFSGVTISGDDATDSNRAAVGGSLMSGVSSRWTAASYSLVGGGENVITLLIGINDFGWNSASGTDSAFWDNTVRPWVAARISAGWEVIVATIPEFEYGYLSDGSVDPSPPGGWRGYSTTMNHVNQFNADVRADSVSYGYYVFDMATDSLLNDRLNTTYRSLDRIHYTQAGNQRLLDLIVPVINQVSVVVPGDDAVRSFFGVGGSTDSATQGEHFGSAVLSGVSTEFVSYQEPPLQGSATLAGTGSLSADAAVVDPGMAADMSAIVTFSASLAVQGKAVASATLAGMGSAVVSGTSRSVYGAASAAGSSGEQVKAVAGYRASATLSQVARIRVSTNPYPVRFVPAVGGQSTSDALVAVAGSGTGGV